MLSEYYLNATSRKIEDDSFKISTFSSPSKCTEKYNHTHSPRLRAYVSLQKTCRVRFPGFPAEFLDRERSFYIAARKVMPNRDLLPARSIMLILCVSPHIRLVSFPRISCQTIFSPCQFGDLLRFFSPLFFRRLRRLDNGMERRSRAPHPIYPPS